MTFVYNVNEDIFYKMEIADKVMRYKIVIIIIRNKMVIV